MKNIYGFAKKKEKNELEKKNIVFWIPFLLGE